MKRKHLTGQSIVAYILLIAFTLTLLVYLKPVFVETDKALEYSTAKKNTNLNKEGILANTSAPTNIITASPLEQIAHEQIVDSEAIPEPPPNTGNCGPNGCGSIDLAAEQNVCGVIPGAAGVLTDGCWVCDHLTSFWYWDHDFANCNDYWYSNLAATCSDACIPSDPPANGIAADGSCYTCVSKDPFMGTWQLRNDDEEGETACNYFWNYSRCLGTDTTYTTTVGCTGAPPVWGIYVEPNYGTRCWVCDGAQWINSANIAAPWFCEEVWLRGNAAGLNYATARANNTVQHGLDFPYCGCVIEPPARGANPYGSGECWVCNSVEWVRESDPVKCNDFWVNDNCLESFIPSGVSCNNALPQLPTGTYCWLCTNPYQDYLQIAYLPMFPLFSDYGEPCDSFWLDEEYPAYLRIPGTTQDVDTVCADELPTTDGVKKPGIVYNEAADEWGCWLCSDETANYEWVSWLGGRFEMVGGEQYMACEDFWMFSRYPLVMPGDLPIEERIYEYAGNEDDTARSVVESGAYLYITGDEASDAGGGASDIMVAKVEKATGEFVWKKQYGGAGNEQGYSIATYNNSIYIAGSETSDAAGGNYDIALFMLDDAGNLGWKRQYGGPGYEQAYGITASDNALYITGYETSDPAGGNQDIFVMSVDFAGNVLWRRQYGGTGRDFGKAIVFSAGSLYVTGGEMSDLDGEATDVFVMKLDTAGNVLWKKQYGGVNSDIGNGITVGGANIYVTGSEVSDRDGGGLDAFVMKLNSSGNVLWKNQYGGTGYDCGHSVATSPGFIYITGEEDSDPEAGANATYPGARDMFLMKLNESDGSVVWKQQHGGAFDEAGRGVVIADGYVYAVGEESSDADGGLKDILILSIYEQQPTNITDDRIIDDWTLEGTTIDLETINEWAVSGHDIDEWTVVGNNITNWSVAGDPAWTGSDPNWPLEGVALNDEQVDWSPIASTATTNPPPQEPPPMPPIIVEENYQYGGTKDDIGYSIDVPGDGYVYICGMDESDTTNLAQRDAFVIKIKIDGGDDWAGTIDDGSIIWKTQYGTTSNDIAFSIYVDGPGGDIFVTGVTGESGGTQDAFLMRLDNDGNIIWNKQFGGNLDDIGIGMDFDDDDVFLVAMVEDDENMTGAGRDLIVTQIHVPDGTTHWVKRFGGIGDEIEGDFEEVLQHSYARSISVPGDGFVYVVLDEQSDDTPVGAGARDIAVLKMTDTNDSTVEWMKQYGGMQEEKAYSVDVPGDGYIYIAGEESSSAPNDGGADVLVMRIDENTGVIDWAKQFGGAAGDDIAKSIVVEGDYIFVAGEENSTPEGGGSDIFVMHLNKNDGSHIWSKEFGGILDEVAYSVDIDDENIYVTGYEESDIDGGDADIVLLKIKREYTDPTSIINWETMGINIAFDTTHGAYDADNWCMRGYDYYLYYESDDEDYDGDGVFVIPRYFEFTDIAQIQPYLDTLDPAKYTLAERTYDPTRVVYLSTINDWLDPGTDIDGVELDDLPYGDTPIWSVDPILDNKWNLEGGPASMDTEIIDEW